MDKLLIPPLQDSYSVEDVSETHRVELDGGLGRYRRDLLGGNHKVPVRWSLTPNEYIYLSAFYRSKTRHGSDAFIIELAINSSVKSEYQAHFVPSTLRLDGIEDGDYKCSATLEVTHIPYTS